MKTPGNNIRFTSLFYFTAFAAVLAVLLSVPIARAAGNTTWSGSASTSWGTTGNWDTGLPSATTSAVFNTSTIYANQPTLFAASTAQGIWDTGASGGVTTTISGAFGLTITGNATLNGITNAGILLDGAGNNSLTIDSSVTSVTLSNNTSFIVNDGGTLTLAAPLNLNAKTLTLGGNNASGNIVISGATTATAGAMTVNTSGTVTLSGNNLNTGATTLTAGTLIARTSTGALGAGALSLGGGTLILQNDTGLAFGRNTTVTGATTIKSDVATYGGAGVTQTLGTLSIGLQVLTIAGGSNVTSGVAGITFLATTLSAGPTINIVNPANGGQTLLTLGAITNATFSPTLTGNGNFAQTGVMAGTGGLILGAAGGTAFSGTAVLNQANTYSGATIINSGVLRATTTVQATGTTTFTLNGGELQLANSDVSWNYGNASTLSWNSKITMDRNTSGAGITGTLGALTAGGQTLTIAGGSNITSGIAGVTFGLLTLTGPNIFNLANPAGGITQLTVGSIVAPQNFNGGVMLTGNGNFVQTGTMSAAINNFTLGLVGGAAYSGTANLNQALNANASSTFLNSGVLRVTGSSLSNTTLYIRGGELQLANDAGTNLARNTNVYGNTQITSDVVTGSLAGTTGTLGTLAVLGPNTLTIAKGSNVGSGTAGIFFSGAATMNANTTFSVNSGAQLTLNSTLANGGFTPTFSGAGNSTVTGAISGGGGINMNGTGLLTLTAANSYTGATSITSGTVTLGNVAGLGTTTTAVLNMTGGRLDLAAVGSTLLALSGNTSSTISSSGVATLTVNPVANTNSNFAGTIGGGGGTLGVTVNGGGALTLSGNNSYSGGTILTAGQLNINNNNAIGSAGFTLTTGIIDNTSAGDVSLATTNALTLGGNFSFGGSGNLNLGAGTLSEAASRTINLLGSNGKTLTVQNWSNTAANVVNTFLAMPGSNSTISIGAFNTQTAGTAGTTGGVGGNANISITGGIVPTITGNAFVYNGAGTLTLTGVSSYTGATTLNSGTMILDATGGTATLPSGNVMTLAGGSFIFKGNAGGTGQTLGNITLNAGASSLQVVGGAAGTTLTLGTMTDANNNSMLNINLSGNSPAVTTTTGTTNGIFGTRGAITVTTGGTTEFATPNGGSLVQYTGQTPFVTSAPTSTVNYGLTDGSQLVAGGTMNSLRITTTQSSQSLDLNGKILGLTSGGLLFVGSNAYTIQDVATGGVLKSLTATNSDLIIHNFGTGGLTISAVVGNGTGTSVLSLDGPGVTTLSGVNTYTGVTQASGGAIVNISADSGLGAVANGAALTLNNATLQAGATFGLYNGSIGTNDRQITLGAGGGTFDTQGNNLTITGTISGANGNLTKVGSGSLILAGTNTYAGGFTNIQNGTLILGTKVGANVGALSTATMIVLGNGGNSGVFQLGDSSNAVPSQAVAGLFTSGNGTGNAVVGGNASNSTLTFTGSLLTPSVYAGTLGGAGTNNNNLALTVTAGSLTLSGSNTYAGATTISGAAVLNLNNNSALGTGTLAVTNVGAVLDNTSGSTKTLSNNVTTTTGFVFAGSNNLTLSNLSTTLASTPISVWGNSTLTFSSLTNNVAGGAALTLTVNGSTGTLSLGGFNMQGISGSALTDIIGGSGNVNITGSITPGSFNTNNALTYNGTGILTLSGSNTYTGVTTMSGAGGILKFGAGGSLNGSQTGGALTVSAGTIDLGGQSITTGTFTPTAGLVTSSAANGMLTSWGLVSGAANFSGNLSLNLTSVAGASAANLSGNYLNTGNIALNNASTTVVNFNGASVANIGNLTLNANSNSLVGNTINISSGYINPAGLIINSGTGSFLAVTGTNNGVASISPAVTINGPIGAAVTGIVQNSANTPMLINNYNSAFTGSVKALSGALILGTVTAVNNASILVGDTTGSANGSLLLQLPSATRFQNNITVQAGNTGTSTIGQAAGGAVLTLSGVITLNKDVSFSPFNNVITVSGTGNITGVGGITLVNGGLPLSTSGQAYGAGGNGLILNGPQSYQGDTKILSGILQLNGPLAGTADLRNYLGSSNNDVLVGDTFGFRSAGMAFDLAQLGFAGQSFSRNITIQAGNGGLETLGYNAFNFSLSGNITMNKSFAVAGQGYGSTVALGVYLGITGNLLKGAGAIGAVSLTNVGKGLTYITGTGNNYDGGTIMGDVGTIYASGSGTLGSGNVAALVGTLQLDGSTALASGKGIYVGPLGAVAIGTDTQAFVNYLNSVINPSSSGAISLGTSMATGTLNLAAFGNGNMTLGADATSYVYSSPSLGANADGNYHLGYGGDMCLFTIASNVLSGTGQVIIGSPNNGGQNRSGAYTPLYGTVTLTGTNTYSGGTVVNVGSTLFGTQAAAGAPAGTSSLGSGSGSMILHGAGGTGDGGLILQSSSTSTVATNLGALTYDGASQIQVYAGTAGGTNTLTFASMTRSGNAILGIRSNVLVSATAGLGVNAFLFNTAGVTTTPAGVSGGGTANMAPAYYMDTQDTTYFMSYDAVKGFAPITNPYTAFAGAPTNAILNITANQALTGATTIYALGCNLTAAAAAITNTSGTNTTLTINSGGINFYSSSQYSFTIGSATANQFVNVDFGGADAVINMSSGNGQALTFQNNIMNTSTNGITVSASRGNCTLTLAGTASTFVGPVTVLNATFLSISNDLNLGGVGASLNNGLVLNGGKVNITAGGVILNSNRTITIGSNGGTINLSSGGYGAFADTIASKITGNGPYLELSSGFNGGGANTVVSTIALTNTANDFTSPLYLGSFQGSSTQGPLTVIFDNDLELGGSSSTVNLLGGNSYLRYTGTGAMSASRGFNFMTQGGGIEVTGTSGPLTLSGTVGGAGPFNKIGTGTLLLTGSNNYTGNTVVCAGILNISNPSALGITNAVISGSNGVSGSPVYIQPNAELDIQGGIAIGGAGGKTIYVSGTGAGGGGAIVNLSGTNSNAGQVVLQANTTISTAGGSRLTLGDRISDGINGAGTQGFGLTASGSGTLVLSGSNSYTGATTINNSTLQIGAAGSTGSISPASAIIDNGNLVFNRSNAVVQSVDFAAGISGTGSLAQSAFGVLTLSGSNGYTGRTTINSGVLKLASANALPGGIGSTGGVSGLTFNGGILGLASGDFSRSTGSGASQVQWVGNGGFAAYGGDQNVNLGGAGAQVQWDVAGFVPSGNALILGATDSANTVTFVNAVDLNGFTGIVQVNRGTVAGGTDAVLSGAINDSKTGGSFTKQGAGTLVMNNSNSYNGTTNVNGGTLIVSGSITGNTSASVVSGATMQVDGLVDTTVSVSGTLKGVGTVGGASVQDGGTLAPGHSPGVLTVANGLTFSSGSASLSIAITGTAPGTGYSQVKVTAGAVNLNGATLNLTLGYAPNSGTCSDAGVTIYGDTFFLVLGNAAGISGKFGNTQPGGAGTASAGYDIYFAGNGQEFAINYGSDGVTFDSANGNVIALMAIPEPQTWVMLISGMGMLAFWQRSRRRTSRK